MPRLTSSGTKPLNPLDGGSVSRATLNTMGNAGPSANSDTKPGEPDTFVGSMKEVRDSMDKQGASAPSKSQASAGLRGVTVATGTPTGQRNRGAIPT